MKFLVILLVFYVIYTLFSSTEKYRSNHVLSPLSGGEPKYEPNKWNKDKNIQYSHNCYSYFLNDINQNLKCLCKNGECKYINPQPGHYTNDIKVNLDNTTCDIIENRVFEDNPAIFKINFDEKCPPDFYKGALTVHPNYQYHFYRQDSNGYWSHKDGGMPATNLDASEQLIYDPKKADKNYPNKKKPVNYSNFCNYYCVPNSSNWDTVFSRRDLDGSLKYQPHSNKGIISFTCPDLS